MQINSLKLQNIRSYLEEEIKFPEGSILLSGDIGTGKSTILLAIEFAIFGIMKGQLSGTSLLRHGKKEGFVELDFNIDKKKIIIKRGLKRTKTGVGQDSGYIMVDGVKSSGTATELKARILNLIGYPDELLTKSKSLIFRYTVYTPQEEMKQILYESIDDRLDTLRKVFDIDKYKRIKENLILIQRELRSEKKVFETKLEGIDVLNEKKKMNQANLGLLSDEIKQLKLKIETAAKSLKEKNESLLKYEERIKQLTNSKNKKTLLENNLRNNEHRLKEIEQNIENNTLKIKELQQDLANIKMIDEKALQTKFEANSKLMEDYTGKIEAGKTKQTKHATIKSSSIKIIDQIETLENCPLCRQQVTAQHKQDVVGREEEKIKLIDNNLKTITDFLTKIVQKKEELEQANKQIKEDLSKIEIRRLKQKRVEELESEQINKNKEIEQIIADIKNFQTEIKIVKKSIISESHIETDYNKERKLKDELMEENKNLEISQATVERDILNIQEINLDLENQLQEKADQKKKLDYINETDNWLNKMFTNLIELMEKNVLLKIYNEFNELFREWFDSIIEEETISVRLDESFTPVIIQNGYETSIHNLSGGEKTSVALAYRLALNKVINDFIGTIKTRDFIILDEPTDGFSSEQLDRIRDVLQLINTKQTIIVSHEPKMESYVENVVRIAKQEHVSRVLG